MNERKTTYLKLFFVCLILIGLKASAEGVNADPVSDVDWLVSAFKFVTTVKGLAISAIAVGVTQLLMLFFRTPLANFAGKWRLPIVSVMTIVFLVLGSVAAGMPILGALGQAPVLSALQVFLHQIWVQFFGGGSDS